MVSTHLAEPGDSRVSHLCRVWPTRFEAARAAAELIRRGWILDVGGVGGWRVYHPTTLDHAGVIDYEGRAGTACPRHG